MQLSRKLVTRVVVVVAILVVLGLFVWKMSSKSKYTIESIKAGAEGTPEGILYSTLATCQNTFTESTLGSVVVHDSITCTGQTVTAHTVLPHKYTNGSTIYIQGVSTDGTTIETAKGYNTLPGVAAQVTVTSNREFTYPAVGGSCGGPSITQNGYSWLSTYDNVNTANVTRTNCITTAVSTFMTAKCKWAGGNTVPTAADGDAYTAYTAYAIGETSSLGVIKDAYANLLLTAPTTPTATKASAAQIKAAREADFTAATRKYLNTVCDGYYAQTSTINPAVNVVPNYPNTPYKDYKNTTTQTTGEIGFNPSQVTDANILAWSQYASEIVNNTFTGAAPLVTGSTNWNMKSGGTSFPGMTNWEIAQDIGPGTITTAGTFNQVMHTAA